MRNPSLHNFRDSIVCDTYVLLLDKEDRLVSVHTSQVAEMDRVADMQREHAAAISTIQGKIAMSNFDVFLCHNGKDKSEVKKVGEHLQEHGILPFREMRQKSLIKPPFPKTSGLNEKHMFVYHFQNSLTLPRIGHY